MQKDIFEKNNNGCREASHPKCKIAFTMPITNWQRSSMTAETQTLQGDLFDGTPDSPVITKPSKDKDQNHELINELSDSYLKKEAEKRPRTKRTKNIKNDLRAISDPVPSKSINNRKNLSWSHHNQVNIAELTPVMRHYVELKIKNPKRILLYRLGDFFECFFEDAILLAQILELTLTGKEAGKAIGRIPMAGIPHHAAEKYCSALIQKGFSIALCDQLENAKNKEGKLVKRGITRILTPGTVIEEGMLEAKKNNWLAAISIDSDTKKNLIKWGLANADISTGEFIAKEGTGINSLEQELIKIEASEIICEQIDEYLAKQFISKHLHINQIEKTNFTLLEARTTLKKHFKLQTLDGLGIKEWIMATRAAGGLLRYLIETNPINMNEKESSKISLELPQILISSQELVLDAQTKKNLEITNTQRESQFQGSLLWAIDRTLTSMGGRCLRRWIEHPLIDSKKIIARQSVVSIFVNTSTLRQSIRKLLRAMGDLERLSGRAGAGHASGRDLNAIADGIERLPILSEYIKKLPLDSPEWVKNLKIIDPKLIKLAKVIKSNLVENPPLSLTDGDIINDGVDKLLDGIRNKLDEHYEWLKNQEFQEKKLSGNANLKIQYHRTFGYFLAVSKSKANNVPNHWIRRQTLANEERFITPDLKEREGKIFQLQARASQREYELFCKLRELVGNHSHEIRKTAKSVAGIDALASLAEVAATNNYCAPSIVNQSSKSRIINIQDCRHPVVEQMLVEKEFAVNSINIGGNTDLIILTGPNASGKSCYLRQIGLIQLLSQIGSWIPAKKAELTIADRIFTRVGAVDDLATGQSTFMVEMAETAYILNQATDKSLVLLDEIGRGTSTFDGLSIAWAVSEFLAEEIKSRTIFATHYHELNSLANSIKTIKNFQVLVTEDGDDICFLHKVIPGGANKSYGIEAARLAGVPNSVIKKAKNVLKNLEEKNNE